MLRKSFAGLLMFMLIWTAALHAQVVPKSMQMKPKIVDINSAPEADIAAVGIEKAVAKKIVEGRPYRSKRDLVTRELLTMEQYDAVKDLLVARQPPKK
jgi:DNA uptake protein ComE-like DNA-binding protein